MPVTAHACHPCLGVLLFFTMVSLMENGSVHLLFHFSFRLRSSSGHLLRILYCLMPVASFNENTNHRILHQTIGNERKGHGNEDSPTSRFSFHFFEQFSWANVMHTHLGMIPMRRQAHFSGILTFASNES